MPNIRSGFDLSPVQSIPRAVKSAAQLLNTIAEDLPRMDTRQALILYRSLGIGIALLEGVFLKLKEDLTKTGSKT